MLLIALYWVYVNNMAVGQNFIYLAEGQIEV